MNLAYTEDYIELIFHFFEKESEKYILNFLHKDKRIQKIIVSASYMNNKLISSF